MKERGQKILQKLREVDAKKYDAEWRASKWSHIKTFEDLEIKPDTKIVSLFKEFGNKGNVYDNFLYEQNFSYEERLKFWGILLRFQRDVGDKATIEDFRNLAVTDLDDLRSYSFTDVKILTRVFSSKRL